MTVHLVRHADAGPGPHEETGLSEAGRRRAGRIADQLAGSGIERILTSRYVRCVETVTPLAERLGVPVEVHPTLAEEGDPDEAWDLVTSLATTPSVLCSHGPILSPVLDRVLRRGAEIEGEWSCRKGSIWRLHPDPDRGFARAVLLPG